VVHHFVWLLKKRDLGSGLRHLQTISSGWFERKRSGVRFEGLAGWFMLLHHGQLLLSEVIEDMDVVVCNRMRE
jgi:hypothetical protein